MTVMFCVLGVLAVLAHFIFACPKRIGGCGRWHWIGTPCWMANLDRLQKSLRPGEVYRATAPQFIGAIPVRDVLAPYQEMCPPYWEVTSKGLKLIEKPKGIQR